MVLAPALTPQELEARNPLNILTPEKLELLKRTVAKDATNDELELFLHVARRSGLDPFARQIYFIKRSDGENGKRGTIQTGIDGYRSIAERSGNYAGSDDPIYEGEHKVRGKTAPLIAKVVVYKIVQGQRVAFTGQARWDEFYPGEKLGFKWHQMPYHMLAKCAEAVALRKAFPQQLAGLYVHEEMEQADRATRIGGKNVKSEDANPKDISEAQKFQQSKTMIQECNEASTLKEWAKAIKTAKMGKAPRATLLEMIDDKLKVLKKA